jgi:hypothetical protein
MSKGMEIVLFMEQAKTDPRIGPLHISLYMAIFYLWVRQGRNGPAQFTARELMPAAKIMGGTAFYRYIRQLDAYGYIIYEPSFDPAVKSRAILTIGSSKVSRAFGRCAHAPCQRDANRQRSSPWLPVDRGIRPYPGGRERTYSPDRDSCDKHRSGGL